MSTDKDAGSFQTRVVQWMPECFEPEIILDPIERGDRLLEETLELLQSAQYPQNRVRPLTARIYSRPIGKLRQEVGGVMVTLACFCNVHEADMHEDGEVELARVWTKIPQIRDKQASRPSGEALFDGFHSVEINWSDPEDPVVQSIASFDVRRYVENYASTCSPEAPPLREAELQLLSDVVSGAVRELHDRMRQSSTQRTGSSARS